MNRTKMILTSLQELPQVSSYLVHQGALSAGRVLWDKCFKIILIFFSDQECDSSQIQPRPDPSIIREPPAGLQSSSFVGAIEPLPGPSSRPCIQDQDDSYQSPRASTGVKLPSSSGIP